MMQSKQSKAIYKKLQPSEVGFLDPKQNGLILFKLTKKECPSKPSCSQKPSDKAMAIINEREMKMKKRERKLVVKK